MDAGGLIFNLFLAGLYFLPAVIAAARKHRSATAVAVLNLFLGWTILGWIAALVWSFTGNVREPEPRWRYADDGDLPRRGRFQM